MLTDGIAMIQRAASVRPENLPAAGVATVSVVIPCLNEAQTIAACVEHASAALDANGLIGEVVVVDNDSTDGSASVAQRVGARVVCEPRRGYGSACLRGFAEARGDYI